IDILAYPARHVCNLDRVQSACYNPNHVPASVQQGTSAIVQLNRTADSHHALLIAQSSQRRNGPGRKPNSRYSVSHARITCASKRGPAIWLLRRQQQCQVGCFVNTQFFNMSPMRGSNRLAIANYASISENMTFGAYKKSDAYIFVQRFLSKRSKRIGN